MRDWLFYSNEGKKFIPCTLFVTMRCVLLYHTVVSMIEKCVPYHLFQSHVKSSIHRDNEATLAKKRTTKGIDKKFKFSLKKKNNIGGFSSNEILV